MSKLSSEDAIGGELECVASAGLRRAFQCMAVHPRHAFVAGAQGEETSLFRLSASDAQVGLEKVRDIAVGSSTGAVAFSSDGRYLLTGHSGNVSFQIFVWDLETPLAEKPARQLAGHDTDVKFLLAVPEQAVWGGMFRVDLVSVGDSSLRLWRLDEREPVVVQSGLSSPRQLVMSVAGDVVACMCANEVLVYTWQNDPSAPLVRQAVISTKELHKDATPICIDLSPDGTMLAIIGSEMVFVVELWTLEVKVSLRLMDMSWAKRIMFTPSGDHLMLSGTSREGGFAVLALAENHGREAMEPATVVGRDSRGACVATVPKLPFAVMATGAGSLCVVRLAPEMVYGAGLLSFLLGFHSPESQIKKALQASSMFEPMTVGLVFEFLTGRAHVKHDE